MDTKKNTNPAFGGLFRLNCVVRVCLYLLEKAYAMP